MSINIEAFGAIVKRFADHPSSQATPDYVARILREAIVSGAFPAHMLVRQDFVADEIGVSKIPVREALRTLEGENLVRFERNRGARVLPGSIGEATEIIELRKVIEVELLIRSVPNLTEADLDRAQTWIDHEKANLDEEERVGDINQNIHEILLSGADGAFGHRFCFILFTASERYVRLHLNDKESRKRSNQEHTAILKACVTRDVDAAAQALKYHLDMSQKIMMEKLRSEIADRDI